MFIVPKKASITQFGYDPKELNHIWQEIGGGGGGCTVEQVARKGFVNLTTRAQIINSAQNQKEIQYIENPLILGSQKAAKTLKPFMPRSILLHSFAPLMALPFPTFWFWCPSFLPRHHLSLFLQIPSQNIRLM